MGVATVPSPAKISAVRDFQHATNPIESIIIGLNWLDFLIGPYMETIKFLSVLKYFFTVECCGAAI